MKNSRPMRQTWRSFATSKKGAGITEHAVLVAWVSTLAILAGVVVAELIPGGFDLGSAALVNGEPYALAEDGCRLGTPGADTITLADGDTCLRAGLGSDRIHGAHLSHDLDIDTEGGLQSGGLVETGAGNDTVNSAQPGTIRSGPGSDLVRQVITDAYPGRFDIDLGDGDDTLLLDLAGSDTGMTPSRIMPGAGRDRVAGTCPPATPVDIQVLPGSRLALDARCFFRLSPAETDSAGFSLQAQGDTRITGTFVGDFALDARLDTTTTAAQSIRITQAEHVDLLYEISSRGPVNFHMGGRPDRFSGESMVTLDIDAPAGLVSFAGVSEADWDIDLALAGGELAFEFPDDPDGDMAFPRVRGAARGLRLRGCFDRVEVLLVDGTSLTPPPCDAALSRLTDLDRAALVTVTRGGTATSLQLGAAGLAAETISLSR